MKYKVLVCSGGGVIGISQLGAIKYLYETDCVDFDTFIGASIGSLICSLLAFGYTPNELYDFVLGFNTPFATTTLDMQSIWKAMLNNFGLDDGDRIIQIIKKLTKRKLKCEDITFQQLYEKNKKTLTICATCLNDNKAYYFDHKTAPDMPIYLAIRMSISIPYFFSAIKYDNKMYVDGAIANQYPIDIVGDRIDETIGVCIMSEEESMDINTFEDFTISLLRCLVNSVVNQQIESYAKNTILLKHKFDRMNFNPNDEEKQKLFDFGYELSKEHQLKYNP